MKRFLVILLTGIAVAFGTASTAQAHDRGCRSYSSHSYSRGYSSGYCQPRYYQSYNCQPRYYQSYNSCQPRYYSAPRCYSGSSYGISVPGISFFFRR